nr:MAG TPA: hypothetical protein [Caudoviricetes sp.]
MCPQLLSHRKPRLGVHQKNQLLEQDRIRVRFYCSTTTESLFQQAIRQKVPRQ